MANNLTDSDFRVQDEGSIVVLHPQNDAARSWIDDHLYAEDGEGPVWWGGGVAIERRYVQDILEGVAADGLVAS